MVASTKVLDAYRSIWKEGDEPERRRIAEICLPESVEYYAQDVTCHGREEFLEHLAEHQESANKRSFHERAEQHNEQVVLPWEQSQPDGSGTLKGADYAQVDAKGLLKRISSFQTERVEKKGILQDLITWAKDNPIQALGLAGGILYILLRVPLSVFYAGLGVTPEDVGFSNVTILLQSFSVSIAVLLIGTLIVLIVLTPVMFPMQVALRLEKGLHPGIKPKSRLVPLYVPAIVIFCVIIWVLDRRSMSYENSGALTADFVLLIAAIVLYGVLPYVGLLVLYRRHFSALRTAVAKQRKDTISKLPVIFLRALLAYALRGPRVTSLSDGCGGGVPSR